METGRHPGQPHRHLPWSGPLAGLLAVLTLAAGCSGNNSKGAAEDGPVGSAPAAAALDATGTWTGSFKSTSPAASEASAVRDRIST